jgi:hypothetical protein
VRLQELVQLAARFRAALPNRLTQATLRLLQPPGVPLDPGHQAPVSVGVHHHVLLSWVTRLPSAPPIPYRQWDLSLCCALPPIAALPLSDTSTKVLLFEPVPWQIKGAAAAAAWATRTAKRAAGRAAASGSAGLRRFIILALPF